MSRLVINDTTLTAIGDAIRQKTGKSDLIAPLDMPDEIAAIVPGGGGGAELPEEALTLTGAQKYKFANNSWNWFLETYGSQVTTNNLTSCDYMFYYCSLIESIPFEFNFNSSAGNSDLRNMFYYCSGLEEIPAFNNTIKVNNCSYMFYNCNRLKYLPQNIENCLVGSSGNGAGNMFSYCYSLREIPAKLFEAYLTDYSSTNQAYSYSFNSCAVLDKIEGLYPISYGSPTSNMFTQTFNGCSRISDMTFAVQEDGTPYVRNWKGQTIDLTQYIGWNSGTSTILNYNSGITADKQVTDDATYAALKDDPDWFTINQAYSRYNHDSAVRTINSLPDCSEKGGNTIKFRGAQGSSTDGGAINTLTEEEIAVATAKGWTVTLT